MWSFKRLGRKPIVNDAISRTARLTLYDQYGAMAYGVITQIIPQPDIAQTVLIDLFASTQLNSLHESPANKACTIVRLARLKALEVKPAESLFLADSESQSGSTDNVPKLIFNLLFTKGFKPEVLAEQLGMTYWDVLKAMRDYVKLMRTR